MTLQYGLSVPRGLRSPVLQYQFGLDPLYEHRSFDASLVFPASAAGKAMSTVDYHLRQPHMLQYNLTVERQLPGDMVTTLAYGGSRGLNLFRVTIGTLNCNPLLKL